MPRIEAQYWRGAAMRISCAFCPEDAPGCLALRICDIRIADPDCESGPGCPHKDDEDAADEALFIANALVDRRVDPTTAAFIGACLAASLGNGERYQVASESTDETMSEWATRLLNTGTGGAPEPDGEPATEDMLRSVAWWNERGDPSVSTPEDVSTWTEMLLARAYGSRWADACAEAAGRSPAASQSD